MGVSAELIFDHHVVHEFQWGDQTYTLETGKIARQANSVVVRVGKTVVMANAVVAKEATPGRDFFPLTINYQEKMYAAGRIPGGFLRREGRPGDHETLIARLIDRPIRPLFPKGYCHDTQVVITVLSIDADKPSDIPAMLAASAALSIAGVPFAGPIAGSRVAYVKDEYILNPTHTQMEQSHLDLVVAGTKGAILMVESEANELSEEVMLGAVVFGHEQSRVAIEAVKAFAVAANAPTSTWVPPEMAIAPWVESLKDRCHASLESAYEIADKAARYSALSALRQEMVFEFADEADASRTQAHILGYISKWESELVRSRVLSGMPRIDGRAADVVRPIAVEVGVLPRAHGSALFTRGETQALVVATLGVAKDAQLIDAAEGEYRDDFMLHYNFPPYCVGEIGMMGSPKRREIGHGRLAKRGIQPMLPAFEKFPYVLRVVSEITESNGSSSMASVCGTSLALMDAGVPTRSPVAGIAMGLVKEGDNYVILSDIMGDEDHLGDMDFKVAGTRLGITALQMDIKISGITVEIMRHALSQAKEGRLHILGCMENALEKPRENVSPLAPQMLTLSIDPEKIRDIIGKGGATIRSITEETGVDVDVDQDGTVRLSAVDKDSLMAAKRWIEELTMEIEVGQIYEGKVLRLMDFGAVVSLLPGRDGLVHISQVAQERVENINDYLEEGQEIRVKVIEVDRQGKIRLSMKALLETAGVE